MTKFESEAMDAWNVSEKCAKEFGAGFEKGRELDEDHAELPCLDEGLEGFEKKARGFGGVAKAQDVGDALVGFRAELEAFGSYVDPGIESDVGDPAAEGVVDLDGIELSGVVLEEFFGRQFCGIETGLPTWVGPTRSACEENSQLTSLSGSNSDAIVGD